MSFEYVSATDEFVLIDLETGTILGPNVVAVKRSHLPDDLDGDSEARRIAEDFGKPLFITNNHNVERMS